MGKKILVSYCRNNRAFWILPIFRDCNKFLVIFRITKLYQYFTEKYVWYFYWAEDDEVQAPWWRVKITPLGRKPLWLILPAQQKSVLTQTHSLAVKFLNIYKSRRCSESLNYPYIKRISRKMSRVETETSSVEPVTKKLKLSAKESPVAALAVYFIYT